MLPYEKQLEYKQQQVRDNLTRIGKIALPEMLPIAGAPETRFYRNKLEFTFSTKEFTPAPLRPSPVGRATDTQPLPVEDVANDAEPSKSWERSAGLLPPGRRVGLWGPEGL